MIGREVLFNQQVYGHEYLSDFCHYFFGTAACRQEDLVKLYPQYEFRYLNQVHGNTLVATQPEKQVADAHWSRQPNLALVIQTADCLPVLYGTSDVVLAAHAGWRGVENSLLLKCAHFIQDNAAEKLESIFIGPHIQAPDFEVSLAVAEQLVARYRQILPDGPLPTLPHPEAGKRRINLAQIAAGQIRSVLGAMISLEISRESTFSSPLFHSYRRGKAQTARQYSFVAKL